MSDYIYCGFWRRSGSAFIDGAIQLLITFCLLFCKLKFFYPATPLLALEDYLAYLTITSNIILITIATMLYYALFESSKLQATPGKYLLNMKIINKADGTRMSFLKSFFRVSLSFVLGMIDDLMNVQIISIIHVILVTVSVLCIAFTKQKTSIPDMICGTRVVRR
ncbi:RDD family protein [Rickettsia endosymbiont of Orchestes rusci]|uniref:RDD family protein n=1 Tax=Rickettsia endosymbiont of Orchestes rusci TaxID=3066250 RepID=UPI00313C0B97